MLEHIKHIPMPLWIGLFITVVVAYVVTRWGNSQAATSATTSAAITQTGIAPAENAIAQQLGEVNTNTVALGNQLATMMNKNNDALTQQLQANQTATSTQLASTETDLITQVETWLTGLESVNTTNAQQVQGALSSLTQAEQQTGAAVTSGFAGVQNSLGNNATSAGSALSAILNDIAALQGSVNAIHIPTPADSTPPPTPSGGGGGSNSPVHHYTVYLTGGGSETVNASSPAAALNNVPGGHF